MAEFSKIEWCTHTWNPWMGCQHVSPGCDNCYAEALMDKRYHRVEWGPHGERVKTSRQNWNRPFKWARDARLTGERPSIFCGSLCDWLDNQASNEWREEVAEVIEETPELDWLLLTKRPENYAKLGMWHDDDIPANVRFGFTAENQEWFDRRWPYVAALPCKNFVSYEPAIGPLDIGNARPDWIICGGESGTKPRQMDLAWARDLRDQCAEAGVPFFFKQTTGKRPIPDDLMVREMPG